MPFTRLLRSFQRVRHGRLSDIEELLDTPVVSSGLVCPNTPNREAGGIAAVYVAKRATRGLKGLRFLPALHRSSFQGDLEGLMCELVLRGIDANERVCVTNADDEVVQGVTALHLAARAGHKNVCRVLLRRGADPRVRSVVVRTGGSFSPADVALAHGNLRVWWLLTRAAKRYDRLQQPLCGSVAPLVPPLLLPLPPLVATSLAA